MSLPEPSPHYAATLERVAESGRPALEQAEALVEVAVTLLSQPRDVQELWDAIHLYARAEELAGDDALARGRARAGRASALRQMPGCGLEEMVAAREAYEEALEALRAGGEPEEVAELELGYGLTLQALAGAGRAKIPDAIAAYQRALRTFKKDRYPREFAVIHNNLATAYLSMRLAPDKDAMREALAVQSFRQALEVVTLEEDPSEFAMLQSNLGNALQAMRGTVHPFENLLRAVEAYDEALRVRTERDTPVEFANTITNKANALMNLPDDLEAEELSNPRNLAEAARLLREAQRVFAAHGITDRAQIVAELAGQLEADLPVASGGEAS